MLFRFMPPCNWKVAIQIHASAVAASSAQHSVRICAENHRGLQVASWEASERFGNDDRRLRFVAVDGSEDDGVGARGFRKIDSERNSVERLAVDRRLVADQASIAPLDQLLWFAIHSLGQNEPVFNGPAGVYVAMMTPVVDILDSASLNPSGEAPSPNKRLPPPTVTGNVHTCIVSIK